MIHDTRRALKSIPWLIAVAILATGCATPLQQCLYAANQDVLDIQRELDERRVSVRTGYRIERILAPELVTETCPTPGGTWVPCTHWSQEVQEIHHRINPALEAERVALLERQLERAQRRAVQAEAQCRATYPAT